MISSPVQRKLSLRVWLTVFAGLPVLLAVSLPAQKTVRSKANEEKAQELTKIINSKYTFEDLLSGNPEAVSLDEQIFVLTSDSRTKRRIAGILMSIGVKDRVYFDYLAGEAKQALNNEIPWPSAYDKHGRLNREITPAFIAWCKRHGLDPNDPRNASYRPADPAFLDWCMKRHLNFNDTRYAVYYDIPDPWYDLAAARDPRAYDLLIQGLHSHNLMIAALAAKGLARLQDPRAVDELIATGKRVPGEARAAIAQALLYFPGEKAQAAAEAFAEVLENKKSFEFMQQDAKTKGAKGLFPY